jgi:hypothetical protein
VWRHAKGNNLVISAVVLEFFGVVALIAVQNKQTH